MNVATDHSACLNAKMYHFYGRGWFFTYVRQNLLCSSLVLRPVYTMGCPMEHYRWIREQVNQFGFSWVLFTLMYSPACWPLQEKNKCEWCVWQQENCQLSFGYPMVLSKSHGKFTIYTRSPTDFLWDLPSTMWYPMGCLMGYLTV
jgi:hypothetical protein